MRGARIAVLGGAGGIGRAVVAGLRGVGADVTVMDLPASLERHGGDGVALDVREDASVAAGFAALAERVGSGGLDGFVHLAGYMGAPRALTETESAYFDDIQGGNLRGAFLAMKAARPLFSDGAAAVLVSSGLAQFVRPGFGAYAAAKSGLIALAKTCAHEFAPGVRVNAVAPGLVDTAFLRGGTGRSDETEAEIVSPDAYVATVPLGRLAEPDDVAGPIQFLLSDASRYMTGQVLWVNGGAYMP